MENASKPAVLFDWDGVLIDSSRQHEESWELLAAENGFKLPNGHFKRGFGMKNEAILSELLAWTNEPAEMLRISLRKEELYRELVTRRGVTALPGSREFLDRLKAAGIPCAIGSSTHRLNIVTCLGMLGMNGYFSAIISAENVRRGKPDPEVFLEAAKALQTPAHHCIVFEDAQVGIEAALRGGMKVVGVAGTHPKETLTAAHRVVVRLDELVPADLTALIGA